MIGLETALDVEELLGEMLFDAEAKVTQIEANDDLPVEWTLVERTALLSKLTRLCYSLQLDLACYPLSIASVIIIEG